MYIRALVFLILASTAPAVSSAGRNRRVGQQLHHRRTPSKVVAESPDDPARNGRDYWERLVGTSSRLALQTKKEGVLPESKYSMQTFDVLPFQEWLRSQSLVPAAGVKPSPPPLSFVCGVWINPVYKFIFIRNRKTASSTFITAVKKFMIERGLCNQTRDPEGGPSNTCVMRLEPEDVRRSGGDPTALWREYTVITSTRNPWARAASGYHFTYEKWNRRDSSACAQPSFLQFCRDPFIMGKISNLFSCVEGFREGVGQRHDGHWNFDFCHVEPAAPCMVDDAGRLVVDFVIRYERLDEDMQAAVELVNSRRPAGLPEIRIPEAVKWRNKGTAALASDVNSTDAAAFVYASRYSDCGAPCVDAVSDFYATDLELFGWDRPGPPPSR